MIKSVKEYDASQNKPNVPTMSDFATSKGILPKTFEKRACQNKNKRRIRIPGAGGGRKSSILTSTQQKLIRLAIGRDITSKGSVINLLSKRAVNMQQGINLSQAKR